MRNASWIALLIVAVAGSAGAQAGSIDSGMTKEQVVARLGKPISEHSSGGSTYLYYSNGDEKKYGMHDMVALENGKVVDAVFRSSARRYTGKSSSPAAVAPEDAAAKGHGGRPMKPAPVEKKPATKAVPPTGRLSEPKQGVDTRKIEPAKKSSDPTKKSSDTTKKATPAPTKKP
jgi:SmpA/OmlA family protein